MTSAIKPAFMSPPNTTLEIGVFMGPCSVTTNDKYMQAGARLIGSLHQEGAPTFGAKFHYSPGVTVGENAVNRLGCSRYPDVPAGATNGRKPRANARKIVEV